MPLDSTADALLAAVLASPRAVAAHDKAAWVDLFGEDAAVNDPVGSRPHVGKVAIGRFYDTFIGPNTIAFDVRRDLVAGPTVVRDLSISITMSTGATVTVPMHLRYDLAEVGAAWKIARLAAHWELAPMIGQLLRTGPRGIGAAVRLGPQLVRNQGVGGAIGMMRALSSVGRAGKRRVDALFTAAAVGDVAGVGELLGGHAELELRPGTSVSVADFVDRTRNMRWDKVIAAGRAVTVSVDLGDARGVAIIDFDRRDVAVRRIVLFLDTDA
ncbi:MULTISPECIES: nuclear transport factor 2 family protein [Nocardia]|uniref:nuclear transport factor 2 family protein n=1 Tax=Nocardia TaxID=1817 RepID=UPI000D699D33|nr:MULTISPECIES: nuclear transport factor 2 family protein [Nocardia]